MSKIALVVFTILGQMDGITAIGVLDKSTIHKEGGHKSVSLQVWSAKWISQLPSHLADYRAVFWDSAKQRIVIIPKGLFKNRIPRVVLRPNYNTNDGKAVSVMSLGSDEDYNIPERSWT